MINKKTQYALKAVQALAQRTGDGPVLIADLAEKEQIPKKFLEQILLDLKREGLLSSSKGKGGGYSLAKPAADITVGQVIRAIEGSMALAPCVAQNMAGLCEECKDPSTCGLREVLNEATERMAGILDRATIQSILIKEEELQRTRHNSLNYVI